ncbi:pickpocket protein 19-like [Phlebotomus argentipes]|uniref:pickpocket protein 19-like n=1 Tax=Phlebotomus argentipes TaxID=94469 RepID=UPI00289334C3|nr:pickpocket protein 19-like [Phlebotomus argentipes]
MKLRLWNTLWWKRYSRNSTVHGIKYLVDDDLHPAERYIKLPSDVNDVICCVWGVYATADVLKWKIKWWERYIRIILYIPTYDKVDAVTSYHTSSFHCPPHHVPPREVYSGIVWLLVVTLAVFGTVFVSLLLSRRFSSSPLATVIESTIYPVSEIPYPAVTICTGNRINWSHVEHVADQYSTGGGKLPAESLRNFLLLVERVLRDEFELGENLPQYNQSHELEHINFKQLLYDASPRCSEIFEEPCWWRNKYLNCCTIFTHQLTTYGICLAFNSLTSVDAHSHRNETDWPWRTSNYGDWSGLRITLNGSEAHGIGVILHHPTQWPQMATFISPGSITTFTITPTFTYSRSSVGRIPPAQRGCLLEVSFPQLSTFSHSKHIDTVAISRIIQ